MLREVFTEMWGCSVMLVVHMSSCLQRKFLMIALRSMHTGTATLSLFRKGPNLSKRTSRQS